MRVFLLSLSTLLLAACSSTPVEVAKKEPKKIPAPITGRQALQSTFPTARGWAPDCQPLRIRSLNLMENPSSEGRAGAWEVLYVSPSRGSARPFVWSSVEAQGLHEGVFGGGEQSWRDGGADTIVAPASIMTDTPDALKIATETAANYLKSPGEKPLVNFMLEHTRRFPVPVWRVLWGNSAGAAEYTVFIDAASGKVLGKE